METSICRNAESRAIALTDAAREAIHADCPGAYRLSTTMEVHQCTCACHTDDARAGRMMAIEEGAVLPTLDPPSAEAPSTPNSAPKKARKRPQSGSCEHCGAPTGGRFAPGHDAKLKSDLLAGALDGRVSDWLELEVRAWDVLVPDAKRPSIEVVEAAHRYRNEHLGNNRAADWLKRRNEARRSRWQPPMTASDA